jgi:Tol biopolymer transport system component
MRKPRNITRYSPGLALAALTTVTILALGHVALAQDQVATPNRTAATALPTLRANGKIAFTSDRDGNPEIYVMNADGTNQVRLTNNSVVDDHATWSPDGTKLAFLSQRASGEFAIFQMHGDGTGKTEITPVSYQPPNNLGWDYWSMSWSPDGRQITFQDVRGIYIVNADGSSRRFLTSGIQPAWSPDGSKILFSNQPVFFYFWLFTIRPDGTDLQALPGAAPYVDTAPTWSPNGDRIVFQGWDWANFEDLVVANADGTNRQDFAYGCYEGPNREIINPSGICGGANFPDWSPDGSKIVFCLDGYAYNVDPEIWVKNVTGDGLTQLTNTTGNNVNPSWQPLAPMACPNPIDCADFFVRQHYRDFLNREPDADGLAFWMNEIASCGGDPKCIEIKRTNVSAAYFLSIEFQQTGYLVYRTYKASYGNLPDAPVPVRFTEFLPDTQQIGHGVVVNQPGWESLLENNKQAFMSEFVQRPRFAGAYPVSVTPAQFVDTLFANAGLTPSDTDRVAAISEFGSAMTTSDTTARARALRRVAENSALQQQEFNRAFVLMQYFGYLRRSPNDAPEAGLNFAGYNFWLNKLDSFKGDFAQAEMVKAFINSAEYRQRFAP